MCLQILAGTIFYRSNDLLAEVKYSNAAYSKEKGDGLPSSLHLYPAVLNGPVGKALSLFFMLSFSDLKRTRSG